MSSQHDRFLARLRASSEAVYAVAYWLHDHGREFRIPPTHYAPTAADAEQFLDDGDLVILDPDGEKIVQVKHLLKWVDEACPYREIFVGNRASVDRLLADVYIAVSRDLTRIAVVLADTRKHWRLVEKLVSNTGNVEANYACPVEHARFVRIG